MSTRSRPALWALLLGTLLTGGATADPAPGSVAPTVDELVQRVSSAWDSLHVELTARMIVARPDREPTAVGLRIRRAGRGRTRIDFLSPPKDEGKILLQDGDETWLYLPRTEKFVEVPARRNPLAGGVLFEDLFPGRPEIAGASVEEQEDAFVLITGPSGKNKKGTDRIYFERTSLLPFRREAYGSSGRLLRTVHIDEAREWNGVEIPWKVRFVDDLRRGLETRIEVLQAAPLTEDLESLFSRERPGPESEKP